MQSKNIVITGGSNGLGKAIALDLAQQGANIIITYHTNASDANDVVEKIQSYGVKAKAIKVDLSDESDRVTLVKDCYAFFKDVDALINNAGIINRQSILDIKPQDIQTIFEVNIAAPFYLLQQFAERMRLHQEQRLKFSETPKDYSIVNITSISRKIPTGLAAYEATKAALHQFTKSAAFELAPYGIRVNDVAPGLIPTNLNKSLWSKNSTLWNERVAAIPLKRAGHPEEVTKAVTFILSNDWVTGTTLTIDGGRSVNWLGKTSTREQDDSLSRAKL